MLSQATNAQVCTLCGSTNFYKEDGYYFCADCQTQNENIREEVFEDLFETTAKVRKTKIKSIRQEDTDVVGWTSWELYNFALIGLTNQLIEIGENPNIKLIVLQLWTYYLSKLEVAFTSKYKKKIPKMARRYHKKDAEIIYGKIIQKKKKRRRQSSKTSTSSMITAESVSTRELNKSKRQLAASEYERMLSQGSSDRDGLSSLSQSSYDSQFTSIQSNKSNFKIRYNKKAKLEAKKIKLLSKKVPRAKKVSYRKTHVTSQYASGPDVITPLKLLSIIYLALRINNSNIYTADLIRFCRESHLSYYNLDHLFPSEITLDKNDIILLTQVVDITSKGVRRTTANIAKFLYAYELAEPDLLTLIRRFCEELQLPRGILLYAERIFLSSPSIMKFTAKSSLIPNYEGRAMAYIIVVLKTLFGLDDITEKEISRVAEKINRLASEKKVLTGTLFSFCEWQEYIECRKNILSSLHFPSKIKYDPERAGTSHLYLRYIGFMKSKREVDLTEMKHKYFISQTMSDAFNLCIYRLNDNFVTLKEMEIFSPSFTPLHSYITQLTENPCYDFPSILNMKFYDTKVGYMTKQNSIIELASQCGIKLKIIDGSLQYLEKIVPLFEQPKIPSIEQLSKLVTIENSKHLHKNYITNQSENLLDYIYRKRFCKLKVNLKHFKYYSLFDSKFPNPNETFDEDNVFEQILADGPLNISANSDSEDENGLNKYRKRFINWRDNENFLNEEFIKRNNIKLYNHEIESLTNAPELKQEFKPKQDKAGRFVKLKERVRRTSRRQKKKETVKNISSDSCEFSDVEILRQTRLKKKKHKDVFNSKIFNPEVDYINLSDSDVSVLVNDNVISHFRNSAAKDYEILFRPCKNYWMYHCIFSRVKGKNFDLFEKELPKSFLWLLNECANMIEMTTEDLYEEVCLIESYHLNILNNKETKDDSDYKFNDCKSTSYKKHILNKW